MLPQNRRLRHLKGVSLRNLSFARPHARALDDLEADLKPAANNKLDTVPESSSPQSQPQLHHSHSTESLRPRPNGRRRSSTLANASPVTRQRQLEVAIENRAADVFLSLHCNDAEDPIYITEISERAADFDFTFFDLSQTGPIISRQSRLTVKVWAKKQQAWVLLLEQLVDLGSLNFLGSLRHRKFPPNHLLFHLEDGAYSIDLFGSDPEPKQAPALPTSSYNALMKLSNLEHSIQDALTTRDNLTAQINALLERTPIDEAPAAELEAERAGKAAASQKRSLQVARNRREQLKASIAARRKAIAEGQQVQARIDADIQHAQGKLSDSETMVTSTRDTIRGQRRRICDDLTHIFPITPNPSGAALSFRICGVPLPNTEYSPTSSSAVEESMAAGLGYVAQALHQLQFYLSTPLPYPVQPFGSRSTIRDDISLLPETQREFPLFLRGGASAQYRFDYGWFLINKNIDALCVASGLKVVDIRHTLPNLKYLLYIRSSGTEEVPQRRRGGVRGLWAGHVKGRLSSTTSTSISMANAANANNEDGASIASSSAADPGSRRGSEDSDMLAGRGHQLLLRTQQQQQRGASSEGNGKPGSSYGGRSSSPRIAEKKNKKTSNDQDVEERGRSFTPRDEEPGYFDGTTQPQQHLHPDDHDNNDHENPFHSPLFESSAKMTLRTRGLRENVGDAI